jgi:lipopolysaccharide export system protein LptA
MQLRNLLSPTVRRALAGFALTGAALVGWQHLSAQAIAAHDSNAPVNFDADRIELQDRQNRVVLSGNVRINQGGLTLSAARTTLAYTDNGALELQRLDATGGVVVTRGSESARGSVAVYDFNKRLIIMSGNVSLRRGSDTLNGGRLVIDLRTGLSSVDGQGGSGSTGRVSGTFKVPD